MRPVKLQCIALGWSQAPAAAHKAADGAFARFMVGHVDVCFRAILQRPSLTDRPAEQLCPRRVIPQDLSGIAHNEAEVFATQPFLTADRRRHSKSRYDDRSRARVIAILQPFRLDFE